MIYDVHAGSDDASRRWEIDLLPNLIPSGEWQALAAGVAQRATLLNSMLADVYGAQQLIASGLLPHELIFGHNGFLWPCCGIEPPGGISLHVYAADLVRSADGQWHVIADRTEAPSGAGFALENRTILSRVMPELYRELRVQHLASFFNDLQQMLIRLAPTAATPLVVLLTPGRCSDSYFEHVFLARQLGYPLVEGSELTVRDATVYLKTLSGLQRVHSIMRLLDAHLCDPLELSTDSLLGVPGLVDAVRRGRVLITNGLGSGVLESPGLMSYLPSINQQLYGEQLLLPSVSSAWCGDVVVRERVLANLAQHRIVSAFPSQHFVPVCGSSLDATALQALARRISASPYAYVAQSLPPQSQAPVWQSGSGELRARPISMRMYAVATTEGYRVMPGGLTRVAALADQRGVSCQHGGLTKDTWVLGEAAPQGEQWRAQRTIGVAELIRQDPYLPSRVVENLFWFGRYCERCDASARLLRIILTRYLDGDDPLALQAAVELADELSLLPEEGDLPGRLRAALDDADWAFSLRANLLRLQWAASQVRGKLSRENWQALVELQREAQCLEDGEADFGERVDVLNRLVMSLAALSGFALDDMTRDEGWRFLMLGRRIERLQSLCSSLAAFLRGPAVYDQAGLEWLLELGNSSITYRSRYLAVAQLIPVLDLLLLDEQNPHAVLFQLKLLVRANQRLSEEFDSPRDPALALLAEQLRHFDLRSLEHPLFGNASVQAVLAGLADLLQAVAIASGELSERLALRHFAHVDDVSQQTVSL